MTFRIAENAAVGVDGSQGSGWSTVLITGLTGSGKSLALSQLETMGFRGSDPIPPSLVPTVLSQMKTHYPQVAVVLDLRTEGLRSELPALLEWVEAREVPLIFLEAEDRIVIQRLTGHRRSHPDLSTSSSLLTAIETERIALQVLRDRSRVVLDTSNWTGPQLAKALQDLVAGHKAPLTLTLLSFGFKYGVPPDANLMFDIRFLVNPFFIPDLRMLTGQDPAIQAFLFDQPDTQMAYAQILDMVKQWLPCYQAERRPNLTIAIGCTGGQHRSVAMIERLAQDLRPVLQVDLQEDPDRPSSPTLGYQPQIQVVHRHLRSSQHELNQRFPDQAITQSSPSAHSPSDRSNPSSEVISGSQAGGHSHV